RRSTLARHQRIARMTLKQQAPVAIAVCHCARVTALVPAHSPRLTPPAPRPVLDKYCVTCHNERLKTAGLQLDRLDLERVGDSAETWEKVVRKLRAREMPPKGMPQPDLETRNGVGSWLETTIDAAA